MRWKIFAVFVFTTIQLRAALILSDSFSYPNGVLQTVSSNRWIGHAGTTNQVRVENEAVKLLSSNTQDVHALLEGQPHNSSNRPVLFARFKVRFTSLPSSNGTYFAHFKDGGSGFRARVWALTAGAAAGTFRLGISSASGSNPAVFPADLRLDTDYDVVSRLVLSDAVSTLWVDPKTEADPSVSSSSGAAISIAAYALRQATGMGTLAIDDVAVGMSFNDVMAQSVNAPAEPGAVLNPTTAPSAGSTPASPPANGAEQGSQPENSPDTTITQPGRPAESTLTEPVISPSVSPPPAEFIPVAGSGPRITKSPKSVEAAAGDTVDFAVEAEGDQPMRFQWRLNGADIPGAVSAALELRGVTAQQAGEYRVFISNPFGTATSAAATLKLSGPSTPQPLQITIARLPGTGLALVWITQPLFTYSVYASDTISGPFSPLASDLTFQDGAGQFSVPDVGAMPIRFFLISWP